MNMPLGWTVTVNLSVMRGTGAGGTTEGFIGNESYTLKVNKLTDLLPLLESLRGMERQ